MCSDSRSAYLVEDGGLPMRIAQGDQDSGVADWGGGASQVVVVSRGG